MNFHAQFVAQVTIQAAHGSNLLIFKNFQWLNNDAVDKTNLLIFHTLAESESENSLLLQNDMPAIARWNCISYS